MSKGQTKSVPLFPSGMLTAFSCLDLQGRIFTLWSGNGQDARAIYPQKRGRHDAQRWQAKGLTNPIACWLRQCWLQSRWNLKSSRVPIIYLQSGTDVPTCGTPAEACMWALVLGHVPPTIWEVSGGRMGIIKTTRDKPHRNTTLTF